MDIIEYNSLDSQQFETFQSIPEKKKTNLRIWGFIALLSLAAIAGYLFAKAQGKIHLRNPVVRKNPETKNPKPSANQLFTT